MSAGDGTVDRDGKSLHSRLQAAICPKTAKIGVIGLGYVGHIPRLQRSRHFCLLLASAPLTAEYLARQNRILVATDHTAHNYVFIVPHAPLVVDTRNATKNVRLGREKICKA